jgi:antitoxin MazE
MTKTEAKVKKWGNSLAVRIPQRVVDELGLRDDTDIEIKSNGTTITLRLISPGELTLESMLEGITPEEVHGEFDLGTDVGAERWYDV